ncbi:immunoglobulin-binding protein 1 isoform X1 [Chelonoidis abingdonii]|uniref:immunoglobulin-binding protein 1 isoform X1 n=1 Tax=Chelonoidis abingdonii TaxID=106734 RepID=UPI0013F1CED8|nr:immunoglobulin-binding protein 1 isoform X1 [Chelonoidis abingdonii]
MAAGTAETTPRLPELLESGWRLLEEVEASTEPSSGAPALQDKVRRGLDLLQQAARGVAQLDLFSQNEDLEEIASADLKYLLLPALLGALTMKQVNLSKRLEHLQSARAHFLDFLKLCKNYQIGKFHLPPTPESPNENEPTESTSGAGPAGRQSSLVAMASSRQAKIERFCSRASCSLIWEVALMSGVRNHVDFDKDKHSSHRLGKIFLCGFTSTPPFRYKQKKEVENRLASVKSYLESGQAEEEQIREFYMLQIQRWITTSLEEIESIDQEMVILRGRNALKQALAPPQTSQRPRTAMKPFILTRDAMQAKVLGAGYPSLATMTVNDWYEQRCKQGIMPDKGKPLTTAADLSEEELQKEQQEKKVEEDDEETLQKTRAWEDWKDTHPKGYGNRKNMG